MDYPERVGWIGGEWRIVWQSISVRFGKRQGPGALHDTGATYACATQSEPSLGALWRARVGEAMREIRLRGSLSNPHCHLLRLSPFQSRVKTNTSGTNVNSGIDTCVYRKAVISDQWKNQRKAKG